MQQPPADTASVFGVMKTRGNRVQDVILLDGLGAPVGPPDAEEIQTHVVPPTTETLPSPGLIAPIADKTFTWDPEIERWELDN